MQANTVQMKTKRCPAVPDLNHGSGSGSVTLHRVNRKKYIGLGSSLTGIFKRTYTLWLTSKEMAITMSTIRTESQVSKRNGETILPHDVIVRGALDIIIKSIGVIESLKLPSRLTSISFAMVCGLEQSTSLLICIRKRRLSKHYLFPFVQLFVSRAKCPDFRDEIKKVPIQNVFLFLGSFLSGLCPSPPT